MLNNKEIKALNRAIDLIDVMSKERDVSAKQEQLCELFTILTGVKFGEYVD